jgi:hypothetical protein
VRESEARRRKERYEEREREREIERQKDKEAQWLEMTECRRPTSKGREVKLWLG